jgi:hypothetical protein
MQPPSWGPQARAGNRREDDPRETEWACRRARELAQRVVEKREGTDERDATAPTARLILVDSATACQLDEPGPSRPRVPPPTSRAVYPRRGRHKRSGQQEHCTRRTTEKPGCRSGIRASGEATSGLEPLVEVLQTPGLTTCLRRRETAPGGKSGRRDSNPRHPAWEAGALPLNYSRAALHAAAMCL